MRFVTYLRVSTECQGQSGLGLEAHRAAVAAHVLGQSEVMAKLVEVERGKRADGRQLALALAEATLNERSVEAVRGGKWAATTVRNVLARDQKTEGIAAE